MFIRRETEKYVFNEVVFYRNEDVTSHSNGNIIKFDNRASDLFLQHRDNQLELRVFLQDLYAMYELDYSKSKVSTLVNEEDYISAVDSYDGDMDWSDGELHYFFISIFTLNRHCGEIIETIMEEISDLDRISYEFCSISEFGGAKVYINTDKQERFFSRREAIVVYNDTHVFYEETTKQGNLAFHLFNIVKQLGMPEDVEWAKNNEDRYNIDESNVRLVNYIRNDMGGEFKTKGCKLMIKPFLKEAPING